MEDAPPRPIGAACFALQARRTANQLTRLYNAAMAPLGLEVSQFSTLVAVSRGAAGSVTELAAQLGVDRSTLVRNLGVLERAGLLATVVEGRRRRHALTPAGEALLARAMPVWRGVQERLAAAMGPETEAAARLGLALLRRTARDLAGEG